MKNKTTHTSELPRPLKVEKISAGGIDETILASERELHALAERFDLIEITDLEARLHVRPEKEGTFAVDGSFTANVMQRCVVTLEPLPARVEQPIHVHFAPPEFVGSGVTERDMEEDDMEPIENGTIDLGELVAQHLGLALNPYPRKSGLPPLEMEFGQPAAAPASPFAKLASLKNKDKG